MAGRRKRSYRTGDLNEELGILLVKGIAAVATVPRPEDVGVDAVATLLRDAEKDLLIAENSFYMQFKSASERRIKYAEHEVRWLENLRLPFFIGSIRQSDSAIDLYGTHRLSQAMIEMQHKRVHLLLDGGKVRKADPNVRYLDVGPPLHTWTTQDLANPEFAREAYSILKPYLDAEQRNIEFRGIRYLETIRWETGKPPKCEQCKLMVRSDESKEETLRLFRSMAPHICFSKCVHSA